MTHHHDCKDRFVENAVCVCFDRSQPNCPFLTKIGQERAIWSGTGNLVVNGRWVLKRRARA
jgi:hypothetical protein